MLSDRLVVDVFPILSQDGAGSSAATGAPVQEQTEIQWLASPIATSTQRAGKNVNSICADIPNEAEDKTQEGGMCVGSEMEITGWTRLFCGQVEAETTAFRLKTPVILRQNYHV